MNKNNYIVLIVFLFLLVSVTSVSSKIRGGASVSFSNIGITCDISGGDSASWINITQNEEYTKISDVFNGSGNVGNCSLYTEEIGMACCPMGYECNESNGGCSLIPPQEDFCSKFETRQSCNDGKIEGENEIKTMYPESFENQCTLNSGSFLEEWNNELLCVNRSRCQCEWKGTKCEAVSSTYKVCVDSGDNKTSEDIGKCTYSVTKKDDLCESLGKLRLTYSVTSDREGHSCPAGSVKEINCSDVAILPFFGMLNFLISMLAIGGVYFFLGKK